MVVFEKNLYIDFLWVSPKLPASTLLRDDI